MTNDKILAQFQKNMLDARKPMWFGAMKMVQTGKARYAQKAAQFHAKQSGGPA